MSGILILKRIVAGLFLESAAVFAQAPAGGPTFEVASIKPAAPITVEQRRAGKAHIGLSIDGARVDIGSFPISALIMMAYRVKPYQISGPDWMTSQKFDIQAKLPDGVSREQVPEMVRALLAERFMLAVHRQSKEYPVYALVLGNHPLKLKEIPPGTAPVLRPSLRPDGTLHAEMRTTAAGLADFLTPYLDRPVVDVTELKGMYEFGLDVSRDEARSAASPGLPGAGGPPSVPQPDGSRSPFFWAVEQLGLKLQPRNLPVEMLVVDRLEKIPTEN